jgi:hypothetical protein
VTEELDAVERELDRLTTAILPLLRAEKRLILDEAQGLLALGPALAEALHGATVIPRALVGKLYFVFTALLTEAGYATEPAPILDLAWAWEEQLNRVFGPSW